MVNRNVFLSGTETSAHKNSLLRAFFAHFAGFFCEIFSFIKKNRVWNCLSILYRAYGLVCMKSICQKIDRKIVGKANRHFSNLARACVPSVSRWSRDPYRIIQKTVSRPGRVIIYLLWKFSFHNWDKYVINLRPHSLSIFMRCVVNKHTARKQPK